MKESGKKSWLLKKSYEVAYAVFRIAAKMDERSLADHMKDAGAALIGSAAASEYGKSLEDLEILEYLSRFAMDVNIMGMTNGEILLKEIAELKAAYNQVSGQDVDVQSGATKSENPAKGDEIDLSQIFSSEKFSSGIRQETIRQKEFEKSGNDEFGNRKGGYDSESGNIHEQNHQEIGNGNGGNGSVNAAMRQMAILKMMRQSGNCRMKDIQDILPDTSERTIRYDLQTMIEQNIIERIGVGGPSVFYRIREQQI